MAKTRIKSSVHLALLVSAVVLLAPILYHLWEIGKLLFQDENRIAVELAVSFHINKILIALPFGILALAIWKSPQKFGATYWLLPIFFATRGLEALQSSAARVDSGNASSVGILYLPLALLIWVIRPQPNRRGSSSS